MIYRNSTPLLSVEYFVTHSGSHAPDIGHRFNHEVHHHTPEPVADEPTMELFEVRRSFPLVEDFQSNI